MARRMQMAWQMRWQRVSEVRHHVASQRQPAQTFQMTNFLHHREIEMERSRNSYQAKTHDPNLFHRNSHEFGRTADASKTASSDVLSFAW